MIINGRAVPVTALSGVLGLIGLVVTGWLFLDERFLLRSAHATDMVDIKGRIADQALSFEEAMLEQRMDVIEARLDRAEEQPEANDEKIRKLKRTLDRLDSRQIQLQDIRDKGVLPIGPDRN